MSTESSPSARSPRKGLGIAPTALLLGPSSRFGTDAGWYMGVVLQQACEAVRRWS